MITVIKTAAYESWLAVEMLELALDVSLSLSSLSPAETSSQLSSINKDNCKGLSPFIILPASSFRNVFTCSLRGILAGLSAFFDFFLLTRMNCSMLPHSSRSTVRPSTLPFRLAEILVIIRSKFIN